MLNKPESLSQKRIMVVFLILQIIVLWFAVNRFQATTEAEFTMGNNYSLSDEGTWKFYVNSSMSTKEHTLELIKSAAAGFY